MDRPGFDSAAIDAGEELLTRFAHQFGPKELRRLAEQVIDAIDPDGSLPREKLNRDRRFLHLRPTRDGGYAGEFRLTGECGVKLQALLGPLAKPRINTTTGPDGQLIEEPDPRHHGQRMHDALEDVCDRLLRARIASRSQTIALHARDGRCSFPGCDTAPEWCERHHIISWVDGGITDLDNLTLLCRYHHHNFASKGWDCTINNDGLPEWRPP